jgi:hypothetical protein
LTKEPSIIPLKWKTASGSTGPQCGGAAALERLFESQTLSFSSEFREMIKRGLRGALAGTPAGSAPLGHGTPEP